MGNDEPLASCKRRNKRAQRSAKAMIFVIFADPGDQSIEMMIHTGLHRLVAARIMKNVKSQKAGTAWALKANKQKKK